MGGGLHIDCNRTWQIECKARSLADRDVPFVHVRIGNGTANIGEDRRTRRRRRRTEKNNWFTIMHMIVPIYNFLPQPPNYILNSSSIVLPPFPHACKCKCTQTVGEGNVIHHLLLLADWMLDDSICLTVECIERFKGIIWLIIFSHRIPTHFLFLRWVTDVPVGGLNRV